MGKDISKQPGPEQILIKKYYLKIVNTLNS